MNREMCVVDLERDQKQNPLPDRSADRRGRTSGKETWERPARKSKQIETNEWMQAIAVALLVLFLVFLALLFYLALLGPPVDPNALPHYHPMM